MNGPGRRGDGKKDPTLREDKAQCPTQEPGSLTEKRLYDEEEKERKRNGPFTSSGTSRLEKDEIARPERTQGDEADQKQKMKEARLTTK